MSFACLELIVCFRFARSCPAVQPCTDERFWRRCGQQNNGANTEFPSSQQAQVRVPPVGSVQERHDPGVGPQQLQRAHPQLAQQTGLWSVQQLHVVQEAIPEVQGVSAQSEEFVGAVGLFAKQLAREIEEESAVFRIFRWKPLPSSMGAGRGAQGDARGPPVMKENTQWQRLDGGSGGAKKIFSEGITLLYLPKLHKL